jgi:hypothetical protein
MRHGINVSVVFSKSDFAYLQDLADRFGVKKSEFLRLLIQSLKISEAAMTKKGTSVEVGGYGIEFSPELLQSFVTQIEALLDGFSKSVKVTYSKTQQIATKRRIKGFKAVA